MPASDFEKEVIDRLARIETKLDADYRALHGNGHPGLIERVADLETAMEEQKSRHKWWRELAGWVAAAVTVAMSTVLSYLQSRAK